MRDEKRKEFNKKIYEILMNPNLMFAVKEQRLRDLVDEAYTAGYVDGGKDEATIYETLLTGSEYEGL